MNKWLMCFLYCDSSFNFNVVLWVSVANLLKTLVNFLTVYAVDSESVEGH
jgi:hypothetical protein